LVGLAQADDAGVYKLRDDLAIIQTVDFFTPIVDDPYLFGQIAVANALSDVYAMGGVPLCAMNIACFPSCDMEITVLNEIFQGGLQKMREAEVVLAGGHTVDDKELKYGLAVTGHVHPERIITNRGAREGDRLILTKPVGTGIVNTAIKGELASSAAVDAACESMCTLNRRAAELMAGAVVHACTDITGFGLLGHAAEMIEDAPVGMVIDAGSVPLLLDARRYCEMGLLPAGLYRNRDFRAPMVDVDRALPEYLIDLLCDPQTSGGLLIALESEEADPLLARLHAAGISAAAIIGEVTGRAPGRIAVR
jgi:selenide,water dikinase